MKPATVKMWLAEPLNPAVSSALERLAKTEDVEHIAVMPDVHLADRFPMSSGYPKNRTGSGPFIQRPRPIRPH
ncbi:MAG TPA: hypothetical protein EYP59_05340 [Thiotrichaceae bacterium]|nr:hypothetical protein [Thiotrichaceae bacterium]